MSDEWMKRVAILRKDLDRLSTERVDSMKWYERWECVEDSYLNLVGALEEAADKTIKGRMKALYDSTSNEEKS